MGASSTLTQIRQFIAAEMGGQGLVDSAWPAMTTLGVDEQWRDAWIFRPAAASAADKVRIIDTYVPGTGTFNVDHSYTNVPVNGEVYEIHTVIEPLTAMTNVINEGLKRCMLETEVATTPVALAQVHALTTVAPWLEKKSWVRSVGYLGSADNRSQIDPYSRLVRGEAYEADGIVYINHPGRAFLITDVLYIKAMKPAYSACTSSGGVAQSGLTLETDKVPAALEWVGWAAVVEAWRRYGQILETGAKNRMVSTRAEAAVMFTEKNRDNSRWPLLTFRPLLWGGPRNTGMHAAYKASTA